MYHLAICVIPSFSDDNCIEYIVVFNDEVTQDEIDKYVQEVKEGGTSLISTL